MSGHQHFSMDKSLARELFSPLPRSRQLFTYLMNAIALGFTVVALIPLISILWEIITRGISGLKLEIFVNPVIDFGFGNAIIGTAVIVSIAALLSVPVGILTGIFLSEFGRTNPTAKFVRFVTSILTGVPSIVVGVFAYGVIVLTTKSFSAFAGGFALATIMLPIIILTTEEALKLVPINQRLASAALGGNRLQTTFRIVVTAALPAITTGILLAIARAAGETAPLIITALFSLGWSEGLLSPTASLPVLIYNLYNDPDPQRHQLVWTTAIILLGLVLSVSIISRLITTKGKD
jgi:phosphate transport system permease protein